jgi:hypothetical protein
MEEPLNPISRFFVSMAQPPVLPETDQEFINADLRGARLVDTDLSGSRFQEVSFRYAKLRGVDFMHAEIWGQVAGLVINGIEIEPLIEAELERRHPGRATLFARDVDGVRASWTTIENLWADTVDRARRLPEAKLHEQVHGEWSFLETLRHLVMVDDGFIRQVREPDRPWYPHGTPHTPFRDAFASIVDLDADPSSAEVFAAREERMAEVRDLVASFDIDELRRVAPQSSHDFSGMDLPVRYCFWRMVNEEWEHHSFAVRDLEVLEAEMVT